jgi:hypothetical protein
MAGPADWHERDGGNLTPDRGIDRILKSLIARLGRVQAAGIRYSQFIRLQEGEHRPEPQDAQRDRHCRSTGIRCDHPGSQSGSRLSHS